MEIELSAFGNCSTDTGSTDCNQVNINVFRFRRSRPSVPHGANFYISVMYCTEIYYYCCCCAQTPILSWTVVYKNASDS